MAKDCSFDVGVRSGYAVEVDNVVNRLKKRIGYPLWFPWFSKRKSVLKADTIKIIGDDEYKLNAIIDVSFKGKMVKRNVAIKISWLRQVEPATGATVHKIPLLLKGITKEIQK